VLTSDEDRRHGLARGAFSFATKPTTSEELEATLMRVKDYAMPRNKRLLIVEDNVAEQLGIRELLGSSDIEVSVVSTGEEAIKKVTEDLEGLRFNTAISALMVFINEAIAWEAKPVTILADFLKLLQPLAPHLAEELWSRLIQAGLQKPGDLSYAPWPKFDPGLLVEDTLEIPVQVNGKLRDVITVPANASQQELEAIAKSSEKVTQFINGKAIRKVIVVPRRLVNIVVG